MENSLILDRIILITKTEFILVRTEIVKFKHEPQFVSIFLN